MTRMIITPACTDKYQAPYIDITESYDKIKNLLENYKMTNFEKLMKFFIQPDGGINNIAQLLVVKKDDYNYTSNFLFENFTTRQLKYR